MADVDKDLAKALQVARTKPRNFAIIAKGPNVLKLLVEKNPIKDGAVLKAKKEYQGNAVVKGVVTGGDGPELVFQVTEEPGVGEVKLRKFITDETKLSLKARFQVVENLQEVDDQDDDKAGSEADAKKDQGEPETAPKVPPPPSPDALDFAARLKALKPNLDQVLAANVSVTQELKSRSAEVAALARNQAFGEAHQLLDQVEQLVQRGLAELAAKTPRQNDPAALFNVRLKALLPDIKRAVATGGNVGQEIKLRTNEAGVLAQEKDFVQAGQRLDQVEALLKKAGQTPPSESKQPGETISRDEFPKRWAAAKKVWQECLETVNDQIAKLADKLRQTSDPDLARIAEFGLNALTGNFKVRLMAAMIDVDSTTGTALKANADNAQGIIAGFQSHLQSDGRVQACDEDAQELFGVKTTIRAELGRGLAALDNALAIVPEE